MKLLICTQIVDKHDPILGSFHRWVAEFAKHADQVIVVCLEKGSYDLPSNVEVHSLGKEKGYSKFTYARNFLQYIIRFRKEYDVVFVHMTPIYAVLGGLLWRLWHKRVGLWYVHRSVDLKLHIAVLFVHHVFTASRESFRLKTNKTRITGHAIDTDFFVPANKKEQHDVPRIVTIGRLSPVKNVHVLLEAAQLLKEKGYMYMLRIIGSVGTPKQRTYEEKLIEYVKDNDLSDIVSFLGAVSHLEIPHHLRDANLFVNLSDTGSVDKAILEAMACGVPTLTSNEAHRALLGAYATLLFVENDPKAIASAIEQVLHTDTTPVRTFLRNTVEKDHSLTHTITTISKTLS